MSDMVDSGKRGFLKQAALLGAASGAVGAAVSPSVSLAQILETGVREDSVLAKCRKEGVLRVGVDRDPLAGSGLPVALQTC